MATTKSVTPRSFLAKARKAAPVDTNAIHQKPAKAPAPVADPAPIAIDPFAEAAELAKAVSPSGVAGIARKHGAVAAEFLAKVRASDKADAKPAKRAAKAAAKPAPVAKASAKPAAGAELSGVKAEIFKMMGRKNGASAAEICAKLGWAKCGATISRTIKAVGKSKVRKERGEDGVLRYFAK